MLFCSLQVESEKTKTEHAIVVAVSVSNPLGLQKNFNADVLTNVP